MYIDSEDVKKVREKQNCSLREARQFITETEIGKELNNAKTFDELKDVLFEMFNYLISRG